MTAAGSERSEEPDELRAAVRAAASYVAECERVEAGARATLSSVEREVAREEARRADLKRMLEELGVPASEDPIRACEEFANRMLIRIASIRAQQSNLARSGLERRPRDEPRGRANGGGRARPIDADTRAGHGAGRS